MAFKDNGHVIETRLRNHILILLGDIIINAIDFISSDNDLCNRYRWTIYVNKYRTEQLAEDAYNESINNSRHLIKQFERVVTITNCWMKEFSLEKFILNRRNKNATSIDVSEEEALEVYYILSQRVANYCFECGTKINKEQKLCWACEHGI